MVTAKFPNTLLYDLCFKKKVSTMQKNIRYFCFEYIDVIDRQSLTINSFDYSNSLASVNHYIFHYRQYQHYEFCKPTRNCAE